MTTSATTRRQPSSVSRRGGAAWDAVTTLRAVATPFVVGKLVAVGVVVLTVWSRSQTPGFPHLSEIRDVFAFWDGQAYLDIAEHGYPTGPLDLVPGHPGHLWGYFFGYPLLIRVLSAVVGDAVVAGVLLSALGELLALAFVYRLVAFERDGEAAAFAAWLLALYPFAIFLSVVYTDGLFIAAATAALYFARRGDHRRAVWATAAATSLRLTGVALVVPLLLEVWPRRRGAARLPALAGVAASMLPLFLFCAYAWRQTGDFFAYFDVEQSASYGNRHLVWPWQGALMTFHLATGQGPASYTYLWAGELLFGVLGAVALGGLWLSARIPRSLATYATVVYLMPVSLTYWISVPRYLMEIVPMGALLLADLTATRPQWRLGTVVASGGLMAYATSIFASGRFLA